MKTVDDMSPRNYDRMTQNERREMRKAYIKNQNGLCWRCGQPIFIKPLSIAEQAMKDGKHIKMELFPPNFFKYPIHLHHDHESGLTVGAVHAYCNAYMWQFEGR